MANQPKKYKKFVATAATATLVASAIVPVASAATPKFADVGSDYADAVNAIADLGIVKGYTDGTFKPLNTVDRAGVVKFLGKFLVAQGKTLPSYEDASKEFPFNDLTASTDKELVQYAALVKAEGVFTGYTDGSLKPTEEISRQQMASTLVKAIKTIYGVDLIADAKAANFSSDITDIAGNYYADAISALDFAGITVATKFDPTGTLNRGQFANFLSRSIDYVAGLETTVNSVSAINSTTLEVKGTGLAKLKAEDITLAGNTVASVTPAADGKTATVKFNNAFLLDQKYTVEVKDSESAKSFEFTYSYDVNSVEVTDATLDNDTIGQQVSVKINGQTADYEALAVAGYTIEFTAVNSQNSDETANFFKAASTPSTSPVVADSVDLEDYTVEVTVRKDGKIVVSDKGVVKVRNLELTTSSISKEFYTNSNTDVAVQNSSTLVAGETLTLTKIRTVNNGVTTDVAYNSSDILVTSSNPAVLSVDGDDITANTPGTATITVSYGDVEKKVTYTVTNTDRVFTKVVPDSSSATIIVGKDVDVDVAAVDQYGDYIAGEAITVEVPASGIVTSSNVTTAAQGTTGAGEATVTIAQNGTAYGTGTVLFKNANGKTLGSFGVKTTAVDNIQTKKLEIVKRPSLSAYSTDAAIDLAADSLVEYSYNQYTSENVYNGSENLATGGYTVTYNSDVVVPSATVDADGVAATFQTANLGQISKEAIATPAITFQAVAVGSTDVAIYNNLGQLVTKFTITVSNTDYAIKSVAFKSLETINYANKTFTANDFLTVVSSDNDDIVKGITLNKATTNVIRVAETDPNVTGIAVGTLYIDADGDGNHDSNEKQLGLLEASVVSGGTGTNFGTAATVTGTDLLVAGAGSIATASGDKGTLVFKVVDANSKIISSTSVNVDVK